MPEGSSHWFKWYDRNSDRHLDQEVYCKCEFSIAFPSGRELSGGLPPRNWLSQDFSEARAFTETRATVNNLKWLKLLLTVELTCFRSCSCLRWVPPAFVDLIAIAHNPRSSSMCPCMIRLAWKSGHERWNKQSSKAPWKTGLPNQSLTSQEDGRTLKSLKSLTYKSGSGRCWLHCSLYVCFSIWLMLGP